MKSFQFFLLLKKSNNKEETIRLLHLYKDCKANQDSSPTSEKELQELFETKCEHI